MFGMFEDVKGMLATLTGNNGSDIPEFHTFMLMFEGIKLLPEVRQRIDVFYSHTLSLITKKIVKAQAQGEIRPDIDPDAFAFQLSATLEGAFLMMIFTPNVDMATMSQAMFENTWKGIAK